jgi:hypothetical protein
LDKKASEEGEPEVQVQVPVEEPPEGGEPEIGEGDQKEKEVEN